MAPLLDCFRFSSVLYWLYLVRRRSTRADCHPSHRLTAVPQALLLLLLVARPRHSVASRGGSAVDAGRGGPWKWWLSSDEYWYHRTWELGPASAWEAHTRSLLFSLGPAVQAAGLAFAFAFGRVSAPAGASYSCLPPSPLSWGLLPLHPPCFNRHSFECCPCSCLLDLLMPVPAPSVLDSRFDPYLVVEIASPALALALLYLT